MPTSLMELRELIREVMLETLGEFKHTVRQSIAYEMLSILDGEDPHTVYTVDDVKRFVETYTDTNAPDHK